MLLAGAHLLLSGAALSSLSTLAEHRHLLGSAATALPFGTFAGLLLYGIAGSLRYGKLLNVLYPKHMYIQLNRRQLKATVSPLCICNRCSYFHKSISVTR